MRRGSPTQAPAHRHHRAGADRALIALYVVHADSLANIVKEQARGPFVNLAGTSITDVIPHYGRVTGSG
jgi:hypothetical protein